MVLRGKWINMWCAIGISFQLLIAHPINHYPTVREALAINPLVAI